MLIVLTGKEPGDESILPLPELQRIVNAEPEGTWSSEQLNELKAAYINMQDAKKKGTRARNSSAAKDAHHIGDRIHEEVSGIRGMWHPWLTTSTICSFG